MRKGKLVTGSLVEDRAMIVALHQGIMDGEQIMIFSGDGSGVRSVNEFLSEEQIEDIQALLAKYLADAVQDIDALIYDELFARYMNPPEDTEEVLDE